VAGGIELKALTGMASPEGFVRRGNAAFFRVL
jgi:hypothetical protein